jgi:hypothetical protein
VVERATFSHDSVSMRCLSGAINVPWAHSALLSDAGWVVRVVSWTQNLTLLVEGMFIAGRLASCNRACGWLERNAVKINGLK